jgi:hypothetical protein
MFGGAGSQERSQERVAGTYTTRNYAVYESRWPSVSPGEKALISFREIRFGFLHNAAQVFENFALRLYNSLARGAFPWRVRFSTRSNSPFKPTNAQPTSYLGTTSRAK